LLYDIRKNPDRIFIITHLPFGNTKRDPTKPLLGYEIMDHEGSFARA
jgi:hypothetical protein